MLFSMQKSLNEQRIRNITHLYYSRPDIQQAIFEFSKNREVSPRYFEGFGKRPDSLQYKGDIFNIVKKGATSFHCSEELWDDPLKIFTGMTEEQANDLRIGWDLLIDIDCKWFEYSKLAAKSIIETLNAHGIKNIGIKFSGSKGFHILIPWKAFPKEIAGIKTSDSFPDLPRKILAYLRFCSEKILKESLPADFYEQFKNVEIKKGFKCSACNEIAEEYVLTELCCPFCKISELRKTKKNNLEEKYFCPTCKRELEIINQGDFYFCSKCGIDSNKNRNNFSQSIEIDIYELAGLDLVLVSPRHLFRMPYSLHEKTALASCVLDPKKIKDFQMKDADPLKVKIKSFMPEAIEEEAKEFVVRALDWYSANKPNEITDSKITGKYANYKPIKLDNLSEKNFPPCVLKILEGVEDGKKRSLFILINLFRSIGMDKEELEKKIYDWNQKNKPSLKEGYIKSQLSWAYRNKPIMPKNCKEFYQGIGVCSPDNFCKMIKNPVNYVVRKNRQSSKAITNFKNRK